MSRDPHSDPERLRDDLAAYALGALGGDEAAGLERHLDGCDSCRSRLRWLGPAVDLLPATVQQHTPPESLRENLMATIRAEAAAGAAADAAPAREPWWAGLRGLMLRPAVGMAALVLVVAGLGAGYLLRGSGSEEIGSTLVKAEPAPGLKATDVSATLERQGDSATLHVQQLPAIDREEVYEVWVQRAGVVEPRSLFVLRTDGTAEAAVPGPLEDGEAVLVTREPSGGSPQPTSRPLLEAQLG